LGGFPAQVVHGHCGEDVAVLPLARLAARRHRCPLVITVHASVRHNMRVALGAHRVAAAGRTPGAGRLAGEGMPDGRIRVIPPGYDPGLSATEAPDPFPDLARRASATSAGSPRRRTSAP
jgi:glycogen synthase